MSMRNPFENDDDLTTTPLGRPIRKVTEDKPQEETWKPLPGNPRVLVSSKDGKFKIVDTPTPAPPGQ